MLKDSLWEAEKYALSKITITFLPRRMPVKDAEKGELGYTSPESGIYISKEHELFSMLSKDEKRFFRKGVFAHELLHQIFTDFKSHERMMKTMTPIEKRVFGLIANVLEDPAIEYWAKTKFGGSLLKSLKFSIAHIYEQSPGIEKSETPFSQFINAFINFGDMGFVKGRFTFPEAKETFLKTADLFNKGILEPCGKKRLEIAKEIMDISRPLWEEEAKRQEEFDNLLSDLLEDAGKRPMSGSGSGESGDADSAPEDGDKEKRRSSTLSKIKTSPKTSDKGKGENCEAGDEEEKLPHFASASEIENDEIDSPVSSGKSEKICDDTSHSDFSDKEGDDGADSTFFKDKELSKEDVDEMKKELEKAKEEMLEREREEGRDASDLNSEDLKCGIQNIPASNILNQRASEGNPCEYTRLVSSMSCGIANTTRQLRRMLSIAREETEYSTRGKINVNRLNCGKNTARVFDKKRTPNDIADLIIGIAVDLSGSMGYARSDAAKRCCIALAEVCSSLNIPCYIMGYTGDIGRYTIVHRHYITWKNSKKDRESLTNIHAECENFDGPSFRYFTNIMRKKNAKHKLMIIVSDGMPCGPGYHGPSANKDTAMAIKDARRVCDVLGVAIGNDSTSVLQSFYGNDFLHVSTPSDLFSQLSNKLKKFVKKWSDEE